MQTRKSGKKRTRAQTTEATTQTAQPVKRPQRTRTLPTHQTPAPVVKKRRASSKKKCQTLEAYSEASTILNLLRNRKNAETASNRLFTRIRALDAKVWRNYGLIVRGTCNASTYRNLFKAMDDRIPLEAEMETHKKAMLRMDDAIRARKGTLKSILRNVNRYVGPEYNGFEENLT